MCKTTVDPAVNTPQKNPASLPARAPNELYRAFEPRRIKRLQAHAALHHDEAGAQPNDIIKGSRGEQATPKVISSSQPYLTTGKGRGLSA